ncbi:MAG: fumarylacetoacetate hydrolase family protein [Alphaproteobacteria bacterium]
MTDAGVIDCGAKFGKKYPDLKALIASKGIAEVKAYAAKRKPDAKLAQIKFNPVIGNADKILCAGLNYKDHIAETGRSDSAYPTFFTRFNNSQVGHNQPIVRPKASHHLDYEGELAVIIGKKGRHIKAADALKHVAGYSCYNDGSIRDWQRHTTQFIPGKNFPATGGFGPWMVTADQIKDPTTMTLITRLNGQEMQKTTTDLMVFPIPVLIEYCSSFTELVPGDVIVTGTPGGVGFKRNPPVYMKPGDIVEIDITKVGVLKNTIVDEK